MNTAALNILSLAQTLRDNPPDAAAPISFGPPSSLLRSSICRASDFVSRGYQHWCAAMNQTPAWHRKQWEHCFVAQVLHERGFLGKRGLGFAVGREPLPALFAALGSPIVASDAPGDHVQHAAWATTGQWASALSQLNERGICQPDRFAAQVTFDAIDMRHIPSSYDDGFDFTWSCCAIEHLGGVERTTQFLIDQGRCLKWGGVGVHTTELLVFENAQSVELRDTTLFSRRDLEAMGERLAQVGLRLVPLAWPLGTDLPDRYIDVFPYSDSLHLRLQIEGHVATSIGLIVVKQTKDNSPISVPR